VEQATTALSHLNQYGAVGTIAAALLILVIVLFKSFVDNALKSNGELQKQNFEMQQKNLEALNGIRADLTALKTELSTDIRELDHTVANMFNELSSVTGGSRGYAVGRPTLPKRG
jgi:hypothetical protein